MRTKLLRVFGWALQHRKKDVFTILGGAGDISIKDEPASIRRITDSRHIS